MNLEKLCETSFTRPEVLEFLKDSDFTTAKLLMYREMKPFSLVIRDPKDSQKLAAVCLVSHCSLQELPYEKPQLYIEYLVVRKDLRGLGLGTQLVRGLQTRWPRKKIYLHCFKDSLVQYYSKLGFRIKHQNLGASEFFMEYPSS